jgi:hypothetical protein
VTSRSLESDHCKDGWKDAREIKLWKEKKIVKEIIIIQMVVEVAVTRAIMAEEDAEDAKEAKEVAAEEETKIVSI